MSRRLMVLILAVGAALLVATGALAALLITTDDDDAGNAAVDVQGTGKGYLGLTVTANPPQGLRVSSVEASGPAAKAGLQAGDFLRSLDGQLVRTPEQLRAAVEAMAPGTQVTITYERGDRQLQATIKLGEAPANAQIEATPAPQVQPGASRGPLGNAAGRGQLGIQVQNINPQLKQRYSLTRDSGIVVTSVEPNTAAAVAGLKAGDVILQVDGRNVATADELTRAVVGAAAGQQVSLGVLRGSDQMTIQITMPANTLFPGFENLPPALQERLRELAQTRNLTPEQLQRLAQGQNNLTLGSVKAISETSITLTRLEGGGDVTYALNSMTQYRLGNQEVLRSEIRTGSTVMIISMDGQTALGVFVYQR